MKALLIVDMQKDFVPGGALAVPEGNHIVAVINRLSPAFPLVVGTQDWHPAGHGSFASSHPGKKPGDVIDLFGVEQVLWPDHCVQQTAGADFVEGLDRACWERTFLKGQDPNVDSYSGFYDNGHHRSTGLGEFLRERGVQTVYVCGLATDYCVKATVLDAIREGFEACVIEDACRGVELEKGDIEQALQQMKAAGAKIITTAIALTHVEEAP